MIRPARPADVPFVARVLEMASRAHLPKGSWDFLFEDPDDRRRGLEVMAGGDVASWCHADLFHLAEVDGAPAAALCTFEAATLGETSLARSIGAACEALGWAPERLAAAGPVLAAYLRVFPDFPPGVWIAENVGTEPAFRRRGLVARLLDDALERGRRAGWKTAQISCLIGNVAARTAYEKAGFASVEERCDTEFLSIVGAPGFARMTQSL
jgi:GNAT superfamily N-acetyltransferase